MRANLLKSEINNNRKSSRIKSRFPVVVECSAGDKHTAQTIDISSQGLLLEFTNGSDVDSKKEKGFDYNILQGSTLNVTLNSPFFTPNQASKAISYKVVWQNSLPDGKQRIGLEILEDTSGEGGSFTVIDPYAYVITQELEEGFLKILEQINLELSNIQSKVIVLTGAALDSGTSTLSWWLASCLSRLADIKVLFVDGNLRPKISMDSDENNRGLLELLLGQQNLSDTIIEMGNSSPNLLNAGGQHGFLGNEVTEAQVESTLKLLREEYKYVIIDTLPVNSSPMTAMLAKHADGSFLVLEAGINDQKIAQDAVERLRQVESKIIGVVLNKS